MKYNIYDVAKKAGVSIFTVSKVINNSQTVREKNRIKVLEAMKELKYDPSAAARSLASGKTGVIGLVVHNLRDSFLSSTVSATNDFVEKSGYFLALSIMPEGPNFSNFKMPYLFQKDRVDGLLIMSPVHENEYILELNSKKIPFVLMDNQQHHESTQCILVDNYKGGYDATKHLLELGHREIIHISGPDMYLASIEREKGYISAMKDAALTPQVINSKYFSADEGYRLTKNYLSQNPSPTAFFAADDHIAFGIIDALRELSIRVPDDISVVGYDDQTFCDTFRPKLTTIRQPAEEMGQKGADCLIKIIRGDLKTFGTLKLEPQLVVRSSTSVPRP